MLAAPGANGPSLVAVADPDVNTGSSVWSLLDA